MRYPNRFRKGCVARNKLPSLTPEILEDNVMKLPDLPGCWLWMGAIGAGHKDWGKYGMYQSLYVHRVSHEFYKGPIPEGLEIDHKCRNTLCVNPQHLEAVTHKVNMNRGHTASWHNARKTHCKYGHEFTVDNIYSYPNKPGRQCVICVKTRARARKMRLREEARS